MSSTVKGDKTADPLDIRLLSPYAVVLIANHFPKAPKQSRGLVHFHDLSAINKTLCINTVFHIYPFGKPLLRRHVRQRRQREKGIHGAFAIYPEAVAVIGWLYLFGGRSGGRQVVAASVLDRIVLVPVVLVPTALAGVFPHLLTSFAILDPVLGLGAWWLLSREER